MSPDLREAVAAVIQQQMARHGMSARQLAEQSGINRRAIDRKLKGDSPFDLADLEAIAPVFDVTPADIVGWAQDH